MKSYLKFAGAALALALCANASAAFVINEIDSDTPGGDSDEFVELKGNPGEQADGFILVFYENESSAGAVSYRTIDLAGLTADSNGYILIADNAIPNADLYMSNGFIKNGERALALYQDDAANFPNGTPATTTNMTDLLVYEANTQPDRDWSAFGSPQVYNEGSPTGTTLFSVSRVPDGTGEFGASQITPKAPNVRHTDFTISDIFFQRFNQVTALELTTKTVTLKNTGPIMLTINSFDLASTSSAVFSVTTPASLPVTLGWDDTVTLEIGFQESDVSANKTYTGAVNIESDSATTPSVSVGFSTELVRFTTASPAPGAVKVNEICYNPGTVDHNNDGSTTNQNDEYVELVNMTSSPILIEGWEQRCSDWDSGNFHSFIFPEGATIPANGYVTVFTAGNPTGFIPGTTFTYGIPRIRNNGSFVGINDGTGVIDGVAYQNATTATPPSAGYTNVSVLAVAGGSIGRRPDGTETFRAFDPNDATTTDRPSPNATNNDLSSVSSWSLY